MVDGSKTKNKLIKLVKDLFGSKNLKIMDFGNLIFKNDEALVKHLENRNKEIDQYVFNSMYNMMIEIEPNYVAIIFNPQGIEWIHEELNIDLPSHDNAYPGGLIIPEIK